MQRDAAIGSVERFPAPVRLHVDRTTWVDEGGNIRDRVADAEAGVAALDVERLVEVTRSRRVDRDERHVGTVELRQSRVGGGGFGSGEHVWREVGGHMQISGDRSHPHDESASVHSLDRHTSTRHVTPLSRRPAVGNTLTAHRVPRQPRYAHPVLILLPPSEGKAIPARGRQLDLTSLSYPSLTSTRERILAALVRLCTNDPDRARQVLGLTTGQAGDVERNTSLLTAPTAPVARIYTGVLYGALGISALTPAAKRRAATRVAVASALFGLVRLGDRIPSYRLGGSTTLPGIGTLASAWRAPLREVLEAEAARGLVVDLRSGTYASYWQPTAAGRLNLVSVRVLQETAGVRSVVSHFSKATKGRLVASLLEDGANPATPRALAAALLRIGWQVEAAADDPASLDVIVSA